MPGSTPRGSDRALARRLAENLCTGLSEGVLDDLKATPRQVIVDHFGVPVSEHPPSTSGSCSIDGLYTPSPPRISVARGAYSRRENFSLLHELAHHLQRNEASILTALAAAPRDSRGGLVEDICDAFAAAILLPQSDVDAALDGQYPSAKSLYRLFDQSQASRAACCVRLAELMTTEGYVVLADANAVTSFVARANVEYPVARNLQQPEDSVIARAIAIGYDKGKDRLRYRSGWRTGLYYADAHCDGDWVYAVYQTRPPSWGLVPLTPDERRPLPPEVDCPHCSETFDGREGCDRCGQFVCAKCGRCECAAVATMRVCQGCWLQLPVAQFPGERPFCDDCA